MWRRTLEGGLVHAGHARTVVLSWETVDVNFQRYRANRRAEVKQTHLLHTKEGEERFNVSSWELKPHLAVTEPLLNYVHL